MNQSTIKHLKRMDTHRPLPGKVVANLRKNNSLPCRLGIQFFIFPWRK